jgi:type IV pilus assembly protein PilM
LFAKRPPGLLGLDLSASAARLVELARAPSGGLVLLHCAGEPLPQGSVVNGQIEQFDVVAAALRRLVKNSGSSTRQVAMALPAAAVSTLRIKVPAGLDGLGLEGVVLQEAARRLPFAFDAACFDYALLPTEPGTASPPQREVLLVAAPAEQVQDCQGVAEACGLQVLILEAQAQAQQRAVLNGLAAQATDPRGPALALWDLSDQSAGWLVFRHSHVFHEGTLIWHARPALVPAVSVDAFSWQEPQQSRLRDVHTGAELQGAWTPDLAPQWPAARQAWPAGADEFAATALAGEGWATQMAQALDAYARGGSGPALAQVLLAGTCARSPGLGEQLTELCGLPCQVVDPLARLQVGAGLVNWTAPPDAPAYLAAFGLALRRFDA